jgi:hypothetical protein
MEINSQIKIFFMLMMMMESDKVAAPLRHQKALNGSMLWYYSLAEESIQLVVDTMLSRAYLPKALNDKCY